MEEALPGVQLKRRDAHRLEQRSIEGHQTSSGKHYQNLHQKNMTEGGLAAQGVPNSTLRDSASMLARSELGSYLIWA